MYMLHKKLRPLAVKILPEQALVKNQRKADLEKMFEELSAKSTEPARGNVADDEAEEKKANYVFKHQGDFWTIVFQGEKLPPVRHNKRMLYLYELLKKPNKNISALELVQIINNTTEKRTSAETPIPEDNTPKIKNAMSREKSLNILDDDALKQYHEELKDLNIELDKATKDSDEAGQKRIQSEIDIKLQQLKSGQGIGGKFRKFKDERTRAKDTVSKGITRAKGDIKPYSEKLFQHLENTVYTIDDCSYKPEPDIDWQF